MLMPIGFNANQTQNRNINFTSSIRFVSYAEFDKFLKAPKTKVVDQMGTLNEVCGIENLVATKNIVQCLGGRLENQKSTNLINKIYDVFDVIFHWFPNNFYDRSNKKYIESNELIKIGDKLHEMQLDKLKGAIFGGLSVKNSDAGTLSLKLINFFKKHLKTCKQKDFTAFFGQNTRDKEYYLPMTSFIYCRKNDTYYVNCRKCNSKNEFDVLGEYMVRDFFDYIFVSQNDKVFMGLKSKEAIPNEFWNKKSIKIAA